MIESDLVVPWEIAESIKKLGFKEPCLHYYLVSYSKPEVHSSIPTRHTKFFENWNDSTTRVSAPTWDQCKLWLGIEKNLDIWVTTECTINEITGYIGHIHRLMAVAEPIRTTVQAEDIKDNFDYYFVMKLTIMEALKLISQ